MKTIHQSGMMFIALFAVILFQSGVVSAQGTHTVQTYYLISSDYSFVSEEYNEIISAMKEVQGWIQVQMGGMTFTLENPDDPIVVELPNSSAYYEDDYFGLIQEAMEFAGYLPFEQGKINVYFIKGGGGVALGAQGCGVDCGLAMIGMDIFPQFNTGQFFDCPTGVGVQAWPCTPLGAITHEIGHCAGLPHPIDVPSTAAFAAHSVMQTHWNYPYHHATTSESPWGLLSIERLTLMDNPFFTSGQNIKPSYEEAPIVNLPDVGLAPVANFNYAVSDKTVTLTNTSQTDFLNYWTYGNGEATHEQSPTYTFDDYGVYTIRLRVLGLNGMMDMKEVVVELEPDGNTPVFKVHEDICGGVGQIIEVPISVTNFSGVEAFQMSVSIDNPDFGELQEIEFTSFLGTPLSAVYNQSTGGLLWFHSVPVNLSDNTIIARLKILVLGNNNTTSTSISLTGSPVPVVMQQLINGEGVSVTPALQSGGACLLSTVQVCGQIRREDNQPVGNVLVTLTATDPPLELATSTDLQGNYCFLQVEAGIDYTISPEKDVNYLNGVNAGDLSRIQRHILNIESLDSPYKIIAANTKNPNLINVSDLLEIQKLILGVIQSFEDVDSWRFIPADYSFPDPTQPFSPPFPESIFISNLSQALDDLDFIGVKIGDVTLNNNPNNLNPDTDEPDPRFLSDMEFYFTNAIVQQNQIIEIPLRVNQFEDIVAMQFAVEWDAEQLEFMGVQDFNPSLNLATSNFGNVNPGDNQLSFLWFSASSADLPDSSAIFSIRFQAIGDVGTQTQIGLVSDPTSLYVESIDGVLEPILTDATIFITPDCSASDLMITSFNISSDAVVAVEVGGGSPPYTFLWSDGTTGTTTTLSSGAMSVSVTVTDSEGCTDVASETITGVLETIGSILEVKVVPNPTSGHFSLIVEGQAYDVKVDIFHASGQPIIMSNAQSAVNRYEFDLGDLPEGMYLMRIVADGSVFIERILKLN